MISVNLSKMVLIMDRSKLGKGHTGLPFMIVEADNPDIFCQN
jgi:hypothetical protein